MNTTERTNAITDIVYEAQMLHRAYAAYWKLNLRATEEWIHNSILEATLVHVRALADFFERSRTDKRPPQSDDVLAEDYGFPTVTFQLPMDVRTHINKRLAHLSYERTRVVAADQYWDLPSFIPPLLIHSRDFLLHLLGTQHSFPALTSAETVRDFLDEISA